MIKKGDFIELDLLGTVTDTHELFDATNEHDAKQHHAYNPNTTYKPRIICVGHHHLIPGLDEFLIGKELKTYTVTLPPEKAFGKKNPQLLKMVPLATFHKQNIKPHPGLQLTMDGLLTTVKTVSGGRVILDFNHPLAGRTVTYDLTIHRTITDPAEQAQSLLHHLLPKDVTLTLHGKALTIHAKLPPPLQEHLTKTITETIPAITTVTYHDQPISKDTSTPKKPQKTTTPK